jgi:hypothetical protein
LLCSNCHSIKTLSPITPNPKKLVLEQTHGDHP